MSFEPKSGTKVTIRDLIEVILCTPGFAKTSLTDAFSIPFINAEGGFDIEDITVPGPDASNMGTGQGRKKITGKITTEAADHAMIQVMVALAMGIYDTDMKDLEGLVHVFAKNANLEFYNWWRKPNLSDWVTTPACSTALSLMGSKWSNMKDKRQMTWQFNGEETDAQTQYRVAQAGAYVTTGTGLTGGTTLGITPPDATKTSRVLNPGYWNCAIGADTDIGIPSDSGCEFEIVGGDRQGNEHSTLQGKITWFYETDQASLVQQGAGSTATLLKKTVVLSSYGKETITMNNMNVNVKSHSLGRNRNFMRVEGTSTFPLGNIDFTNINDLVITCPT